MGTRVKNPPSAFVLMDSMRNIGYTFSSALADIVDNSISAQSKHVEIYVPASPENIYLCIVDDGAGMDEAALRVAMRYGSKGKNENRSETDLGRYGLGLKSASLSQCRRLTVVSKYNGVMVGACWDLNEVEKTEEWTLIELDQKEINALPCIDSLKDKPQGTMILWQDFDVLRQTNEGLEYRGLIDSVYEAMSHLSLIFHRFIVDHGLVISVNGDVLEAIDPFLKTHKKTEQGKKSDITVMDKNGVDRHIYVTPYLLPYLTDLSDSDIKTVGGVDKIAQMQGFYVYRNERLIIYGTWFKMSYKNELAKYARIQVDVPATLDDIWKIDVKKQSAELPPAIKKQLQRCVESSQFSSRRKNKHRLTLKNDDDTTLWRKGADRNNKAVYAINRDAPLIRTIFQQCETPAERQRMNLMLSALEQSLPFHDIYTDEANNNISQEISDEAKAEIVIRGIDLMKTLQSIDMSSNEQALSKLLSMEPFSKFEWFGPMIKKELKL